MNREAFLFLFIFSIGCFSITDLLAQSKQVTIEGGIYEKTQSHVEKPVSALKVSYSKKIFAFTDKEGKFSIQVPDTVKQLVVFYEKLGTDTIQITDITKQLRIVFPYIMSIKDVEISHRRASTEISLLTPIKIENIGSKELLKAACCNLSESFETTPSVDVAFTDAITGYRQIQLLGLSGPYTLITRENIPEVRGIASITGLSFTPGQWIEGMQLSKGTGSVVNGFEGLAGQLNIELKKPMEGDQYFLNLYQSTQGRSEGNFIMRAEPKKQLYTNLFLHGKSQWLKMDQNKDHFIDQPMENTFVGSNRWMWFGKSGRELQVGVKYVNLANWGGSASYQPSEAPSLSQQWGMKTNIKRLDSWAKIGKAYDLKPWKSMGLQLAFTNHNQDMHFGKKTYFANENTAYLNYIFQTIIGNTNNILKLGVNGNYVQRDENVNTTSYKNEELTGGVFGEYAHTFSTKLNAVVGFRADYHNLYGLYLTPRLHIRYAPHENLSIRASIGKSYRTATVFSENLGLFATNRTLLILPSQSNGVYGLQNEKAINAGLNATYKFKLNYRPGSISGDYYYTYFLNQVVADWEDERFIKFYSSSKKSFGQSFQLQLDYEPIRKLDVRIAYRLNDVQTTYENTLKQRPLNARHRAFINVAYTTRSKWSFDYTLQWTGKKRIPSTALNPTELQFGTTSPSFITMNAHINKTISKQMDVYGGVENILNYMQRISIIDSQHPFDQYFDGSLIWGPTMGRNIYVGMRWKKK